MGLLHSKSLVFGALGAVFVLGTLGLGTEAGGAAAKTASGSASFAGTTQQQLNAVIADVRGTYKIPGVAVWVSVPGKGSWTAAYGQANVASGAPLSLNDHFAIGSVTKTFTGTVILRLVQQHRLSLSDPISKWVPQVQNAGSITVRMLLNMTSGIYDEGAPGSQLSQVAGAQPSQPISPQQIVAMAVAHGPAGPMGQFVYSDTNYAILGIIAQAVTHQSIGQLITSRILRPLHLTQTSYPASATLPSPAASPYAVMPNKTVPFPIYNPSYLNAAGARVSTVPDLARWAQALGTGQLLSKSTLAQRLASGASEGAFIGLPGTGAAPLPFRYSLGIFSLGGMVGHNGINNGFSDDVFYLPSRRATVVVAVNAINTSVSGETVSDAAAVSIADIVLGGSLTTTTVGS